MVSRSQVDRLRTRIEALTPCDRWKVAVIIPREGESEAGAEERHYREHPDDRGAYHVIQVIFGGPDKSAEA
jgi:hypothetical protein